MWLLFHIKSLLGLKNTVQMVKVDFLGLKGVFSPFKVAFLGLRNCFSLFEIGLLGLKGGFTLFKVRLLGLGRSLSLVGAFFVFRKLLQKIFHIDKMAGIFRVHLSYNRTGGCHLGKEL